MSCHYWVGGNFDEMTFDANGPYSSNSCVGDAIMNPSIDYSDDVTPEEAAYRGISLGSLQVTAEANLRKRSREENACDYEDKKNLSLYNEKMRVIGCIREIVKSKLAAFHLFKEAVLVEYLCLVVACDQMWSYTRADVVVEMRRNTGYYDILENIVREVQRISFYWFEQEDVYTMRLDFPDFLVPLYRLVDVALSYCTPSYNKLVYGSFDGQCFQFLRNDRHQPHVASSTMLLYFAVLGSNHIHQQVKIFLLNKTWKHPVLENARNSEAPTALDSAMLAGIHSILKNAEFGNRIHSELETQAALNRPYQYTKDTSEIFNAFLFSYFLQLRH